MSDATYESVQSEELAEIAFEILDGIIETMNPARSDREFTIAADRVVATVQMEGEGHATLSVAADAHSAATLAGAWANEDPTTLEVEDAVDTMVEFVNVLGGTAKTLVEGETALTIPTASIPEPGTALLEHGVFVDHLLGTFEVQMVFDAAHSN